MHSTITVSDTASAYIKTMIEKEQGIAFRLSVKKTGCSGYSYQPQVVKMILEQDTQIVLPSLIICLDTSWLHILSNIHIDYIEENQKGLKQKKLVFLNAKESNRCGCGESFTIE